MDWNWLIQNLGSFTIGSGLLAFLIKSLVNNSFNKDLEKFKKDLEIEIEKFKSSLELENTRSQIMFTKLHEERAYTIKELYSKLIGVDRLMTGLAIKQDTKEEKKYREQDAIKAIADLLNFFQCKEILLPKSTAKLIDKINQIYLKAWHASNNSKDIKLETPEKLNSEEWKLISTETPELKENLKLEFRRLLGDTDRDV